MTDMRHARFIEELLDAALARYRPEEARAGLEGRILAWLRSAPAEAPAPVPVLRWNWWSAAAVLASLLLAAGLLHMVFTPVPESTPEAPSIAQTAAPAAAAAPAEELASEEIAPTPAPRPVRVAAAIPRRARFPSPAPLSEQERLLLRFAQNAPPEVLQGRFPQRPVIKELQVPEIIIPALVVADLSSPAARSEDQGENHGE